MADQQNNRPSPYLDENQEPYGKPDTQPNPNDGNNQFKPNALDEQTLRSARSQTMFAFIAGPLSLCFRRNAARNHRCDLRIFGLSQIALACSKNKRDRIHSSRNAQVHADRIDYLLGCGNA